MITVNDILTQFQSFKSRVDEYYALIYAEKNSDAALNALNSTSKTAEFNLWMYVFAGVSVIMDGVWAVRQQEISDKVDSGFATTDRWYQKELLKFQYGDALSWDDDSGKYYYAVIDVTKQIIKRCSIVSSGGVTTIKVAKLDGSGNPVALSGPEKTAFTAYVRQIQSAGANILSPISLNSDKLNAPMTVYYNGIIPLDDIKAIVEPAFNEYLANLKFNGEYSINKHGDFIENKSVNIYEVNPGSVEAKADGGSYIPVTRVYNPVSGYIERDSAIVFTDMITYVSQ
jgi:hypothetical protein